MRIERHIFGSFTGYTTLARSAGISGEDCRILESGAYAFGQTHERSYVKTLPRQPAFFTRVVPGGRRALTRVFEGAPDDNSRATLLLVTAVVSQADWDNQMFGDLDVLLDDRSVWEWDATSPTLPSLDIRAATTASIPKKSAEKLLRMLSEVERAIGSRRTLIIDGSEVARAELRALEMLVPPPARRQFTCACRSLSPQLPVTVNSLAEEAGAGGRVNCLAGAATELSAYARTLSESELVQGRIPLQLIAASRFSAPAETRSSGPATTQPTAPPVPLASSATSAESAALQSSSRGVPGWMAIAGGALAVSAALIAFFLGRSLGANDTLSAERAHQEQQRHDLEASADARVLAAASQAASQACAVDLEKVKKALDTEGAVTLDESLGAAAARTDEMHAKLKQAKDSLAEARKAADAARAAAKPTTAPTAAPEAPSEGGDGDAFKTRYLNEMRRQKERYLDARQRIEQIAAMHDPHALGRSIPDLHEIQGILYCISDNWPAANPEERKWLAGLAELRLRVHRIASIAAMIARVEELLHNCQALRHPKADLGVLNSRLNELDEAIRRLSHEQGAVGCDIGETVKYASNESAKTREWADDEDMRRAKQGSSGSNGGPGIGGGSYGGGGSTGSISGSTGGASSRRPQ